MIGYIGPWQDPPPLRVPKMVVAVRRCYSVDFRYENSYFNVLDIGGGHFLAHNRIQCNTLEEAMAKTDEMIHKQGWMFLTEQQVLLL